MSGFDAILGPSVAPLPWTTLVLGGARSGKSRLGERLVRDHATGMTPVYLASAEAFDEEMRARIALHQRDRGGDWVTVEAPRDLPDRLDACGDRPVLVDCLTLWLSNLMLADMAMDREIASLIEVLAERTAPTVLVSNEVGLGLVPETPLGRQFRDWQGLTNQRVALSADCVLFVAAGLPLVMKRPDQQ
ncbi:MAG: bifunctional adenosylcobinamide kinase/adenosylcobinamide-phosphate guanylyltransferase [Minwuia sp.]|nr:bifunctional adenosylcobinamide kinase/adenosylcobinamide-phosphate guanylyltransferase [Minwuia sp.]